MAAVSDHAVRRRRPKPATPAAAAPPDAVAVARGRARVALLVLLAVAIAAQPLSVPITHAATEKLTNGMDAHTQWANYLAHPGPDVLVLGASNARLDIDARALGESLSAATGRHVTAAAIGMNAATPDFLSVLTYRVMKLPKRPKVIVFPVAAPMVNPHFRCSTCPADLVSPYLWQISEPYDLDFMRQAVSSDPNPKELLALWAASAAITYPLVLAAARCQLVETGRAAATDLGRSVPLFLRGPTACDVGQHPGPDDHWTPESQQLTEQEYATNFVADFEFSSRQADYLVRMAELARAGGAQPVFAEFPSLGMDAVNPGAEAAFRSGIRDVSVRAGAPFLDLTAQLQDDHSLWADPLHLNRYGAAAMAPILATELAPSLGP
jgi:hypothetical protein